MKLPLSRENLNRITEANGKGINLDSDVKELIAQARLAIEYKEALEWLFKDDTRLRKDIFEQEGASALEAIQNARKK